MKDTSQCAFLFPGQGSQTVGMGKDFFENFAIARESFEEASDLLRFDLRKTCFEGPLETLTLTENLQPALFVTETAITRVLKSEFGASPKLCAGHSLGEYSALFAAGALSFSDGVRLTRLRGSAMQRAVPPGTGTMAAILGLTPELVISLCESAVAVTQELVEPANFNAPGQVVIAGTTQAVAKAGELLKSDPRFSGGKSIPLVVSAPFHCRLMEPARREMERVIAETRFAPPSCGVLANVTASVERMEHVFPGLLTSQIVQPVRWEESMRALRAQGVTLALEIGPGKVLSGLLKRIDREMPSASISTVEQMKEIFT